MYSAKCDGFQNIKGPLSYAIGIPMDNVSSDILQLPPAYLDSQQIQLAGGVFGSDLRLFMTILDITGVAVQIQTNTVQLPPETSLQHLGRVLEAGRQLDFMSVISLSVALFKGTNLTGQDGLQALLC